MSKTRAAPYFKELKTIKVVLAPDNQIRWMKRRPTVGERGIDGFGRVNINHGGRQHSDDDGSCRERLTDFPRPCVLSLFPRMRLARVSLRIAIPTSR